MADAVGPRVAIFIERRGDGGLRVYSDDVRGMILSHSDPEAVGRDIIPVLRVLRPDLFEVVADEVAGYEIVPKNLTIDVLGDQRIGVQLNNKPGMG